jgi:DHA2 family multidrug resistance protein
VRIDQLTDLLVRKGHAAGEALRMAEGIVYDTVQAQASMLAYLDDFRLLALIFLLVFPLVFLLRRPEGGQPPAPPH